MLGALPKPAISTRRRPLTTARPSTSTRSRNPGARIPASTAPTGNAAMRR
jgi:hypothetical protein